MAQRTGRAEGQTPRRRKDAATAGSSQRQR